LQQLILALFVQLKLSMKGTVSSGVGEINESPKGGIIEWIVFIRKPANQTGGKMPSGISCQLILLSGPVHCGEIQERPKGGITGWIAHTQSIHFLTGHTAYFSTIVQGLV
jgi:hypothetical protein